MITPISAAGMRETPLLLNPAPPLAPGGTSFPPLLDGVSIGAPPESFSSLLGGVLKDASTAQFKADEAVKRLVTGEDGDVHQVMLAMEQARLSMMLVVQVRNKMVDAYKELSSMQV